MRSAPPPHPYAPHPPSSSHLVPPAPSSHALHPSFPSSPLPFSASSLITLSPPPHPSSASLLTTMTHCPPPPLPSSPTHTTTTTRSSSLLTTMTHCRVLDTTSMAVANLLPTTTGSTCLLFARWGWGGLPCRLAEWLHLPVQREHRS